MKKLLFLDDEKHILKALSRTFRNLEFKCFYASTISEAIEIYLAEDHLDMLITDIKMPHFDGVRVLKLFKEASPETIRVAITGYASASTITEAVSKNLAKQYFYKPWSNEELLDGIRKMFLLEDILKKLHLFEVIQQFESIKTLPKMYHELNLYIQRDKSIEEITGIIERDPAITSNVLRLANSAFYAAKTGNIQQAIMYIGLNNLKQIVLSYEVAQMNERMVGKCEGIWAHANRTNLIFQDLYTRIMQTKVPPILSSAGIVHDIGKIIMLQIFGDQYYDKILKISCMGDQCLDKERELFGIDHSMLGGYFLNWWTFPVDMIEVTLFHHAPMNEAISNHKVVAMMCLASQIENGEIDLKDASTEEAMQILGIDDAFIRSFALKYENLT